MYSIYFDLLIQDIDETLSLYFQTYTENNIVQYLLWPVRRAEIRLW